jgi:hypothetical protein
MHVELAQVPAGFWTFVSEYDLDAQLPSHLMEATAVNDLDAGDSGAVGRCRCAAACSGVLARRTGRAYTLKGIA